MGLAAVVCAHVGIYLSTRVNQRAIFTILAIAMVLVGVRELL